MSEECAKQFWNYHVNSESIFSDEIRGVYWDDLSEDNQNAVKYIYSMVIGVMAENRR